LLEILLCLFSISFWVLLSSYAALFQRAKYGYLVSLIPAKVKKQGTCHTLKGIDIQRIFPYEKKQ